MRLHRTGPFLAALAVLLGLFASAPSSASTANKTGGTYVALGDSYSSGNSLAPSIVTSGACARSQAAYPVVVARRLGLSKLVFVACSGATVSQVQAQVDHAARSISLSSLVTVTAGGNDLPFTGLSEACIGLVGSVSASSIRYVPGISGISYCDRALARAVALLGGHFDSSSMSVVAAPGTLASSLSAPSMIENRLTSLYRSILRRLTTSQSVPNGGQLIVVQYPTLLSHSGPGNCLLSPAPINLPVQSVVNGLYPGFSGPAANALIEVNRLLNRETAAVVAHLRLQGYHRISIAAAPAGFSALDSQSGHSPELNGIAFSGSASGLANNSLHPTVVGQALIAASVVAQWHALGR